MSRRRHVVVVVVNHSNALKQIHASFLSLAPANKPPTADDGRPPLGPPLSSIGISQVAGTLLADAPHALFSARLDE
jgi:hypothetical protein